MTCQDSPNKYVSGFLLHLFLTWKEKQNGWAKKLSKQNSLPIQNRLDKNIFFKKKILKNL